MNITDLIVEFIKQGNTVEFPGMGTLSSNNVSAHHDAATGTFLPSRRTVSMVESLSGNKSIVRHIAEKECVTNEIAEQMWANYIAALKDKLQRTAEGHEFPGLGHMRLVGSKVRFDALEGLDLDAGKKHEQPLENVSTYTPKAVADPFAAFDKPAAPKTPVAEEPKPAAPAPVEEKKEEPQPVQPVAAAIPVVERVEPQVKPVEAPKSAAAEPVKPAASLEHLSEVKRMLDEIPSSPKDAKEARRAQKAAAKAEKEARKAAEEAEKAKAKERDRLTAKAAKEKDLSRRAAEEAEKRRAKEQEKAERKALKEEKHKKKEGKKKHTWIWILLILLLLAAACYFFMQKCNPASKGKSCAREVELVYPEPFGVDDYPLLKFQEQDIIYNVGHLHNYMADYVHQFLAANHYNNAFAAVMAQIDEYANDRLHELMVEGYSPKRLFPHDNFWLKSHYVEYKSAAARYYRYKVQGELMDYDLLDGILNEVVVTYGLNADGYRGYGADGGAAAAGRKAAAKPVSDKPYEEVVPEAPTFKESKQGFDIVAGFFTSKKSANKCANQLKALGSDAYIISKSGGYYVSMGSAATRTAAEAMEKHIKSWYKSDVKIYNFNE